MLFVENISGTLMNMEKSNRTSLGFTLWFPFVRDHMKVIREGSLAAVRNFSTDTSEDHYSVMRITSVMPTHYAMNASMDGYPGFVEEAAMSAARDWNQSRPIEDTTKIVCDAVPSRFEVKRSRSMENEAEILPETNMPMPGERVRLFDARWTDRIINYDIQKQQNTIQLGTLANMNDVNILALWDSMIRTHFGVFAYTNAGKSNLLSTVTSKILDEGPVKVVIYDLMGEYGILLADKMYKNNASIVFLTPDTVPQSVMNFWNYPTEQNSAVAARDIVRTTVLPKMLAGRQDMFVEPVTRMLADGKFKILSRDAVSTNDILNDITESADTSVATQGVVSVLNENMSGMADADNVESLLRAVESHELPQKNAAKAGIFKRKIILKLQSIKHTLAKTKNMSQKFRISLDDMVRDLNQDGSSSLYIIQDTDDIRVREFSSEIGQKMLSTRREHGTISPPVSFIYDEADQFIAQDDKPLGMKESKHTAEQLARRGRKYGLGVGIATQRIVYLDTNILGQPHTYFVSKLPRASDREKIQEAFGLSDETLQESLRFNIGQWLLISHSATGIDGLPIPIQMPDANKRIEEFLGNIG